MANSLASVVIMLTVWWIVFLIGFKNEWTYYDSMTLELIKERNHVLGLIQENLMENSVQNCLPYILKPHGLCYYYFSLP